MRCSSTKLISRFIILIKTIICRFGKYWICSNHTKAQHLSGQFDYNTNYEKHINVLSKYDIM